MVLIRRPPVAVLIEKGVIPEVEWIPGWRGSANRLRRVLSAPVENSSVSSRTAREGGSKVKNRRRALEIPWSSAAPSDSGNGTGRTPADSMKPDTEDDDAALPAIPGIGGKGVIEFETHLGYPIPKEA